MLEKHASLSRVRNDSKKLLTIVTPVFNGAEFIKETLESIIAHTNNEFVEIIVVDDGSNDGTPSILEDFENQITVIRKRNEGQARAINAGLNIANGKYVSIVNADDPLISSDLFPRAIEILDSNPGIVAVYPDWFVIDKKSVFLRQVVTKDYSKKELIGNFNCLIGPGGVFRVSAALEVGGWDSSFRFVPDYNFWLALSTKGSFKRIPYPLATWRTHETSISVSGRSLAMARERIRVMQEFLANHPQELELELMALSNAYYRAALLSFFDSKVPGYQYLWKSFMYSKANIKSKNKAVLFFLILSPLSSQIVKVKTFQKYLIKIVRFLDLTD